MSLSINVPINSVSFGQISTLFLRELHKRNADINLIPVGNNFDLSCQDDEPVFFNWLKEKSVGHIKKVKRSDKGFKLWHLNGSLESYSNDQTLFSFYELDSPTAEEVNIVNNQKCTIFSSNYSCEAFRQMGCENVKYVPLAFDKYNFKKLDKQYFNDGRIVFNLVGKLEKRKNHKKVIEAWIKKFGNNKDYMLQCAIFNPFIKMEDNQTLISSILMGQNYFNVNFLSMMQKNGMYNDFLNSADIVIGMSGGEGWGLPEFQSVALGKYGVILNAHSYKEWANKDNATLVNPSGKIEAYDNLFFHRGAPFNQGNIFDFNEDEFINACELTIEKVKSQKTNKEGLKLQDRFTSEKMTDKILELV